MKKIKLEIVEQYHNGRLLYTLRSVRDEKAEIIARFADRNEAQGYIQAMCECNPGRYTIDPDMV